MDSSTSGGSSWADVLISGLNAYNDSQAARAYTATQQQAYNTQGGVGGQSQFAGLGANPAILIGGALVLAVVLFIALRK